MYPQVLLFTHTPHAKKWHPSRTKANTLFSHFRSSFFLPRSYTRKSFPTPIKTRPWNGAMAAGTSSTGVYTGRWKEHTLESPVRQTKPLEDNWLYLHLYCKIKQSWRMDFIQWICWSFKALILAMEFSMPRLIRVLDVSCRIPNPCASSTLYAGTPCFIGAYAILDRILPSHWISDIALKWESWSWVWRSFYEQLSRICSRAEKALSPQSVALLFPQYEQDFTSC